MELDSRIIEGKKPLTAFDVMESKFIGTDCYFSDKASDYGDLSNCQKGCLLSRDGMTGMFNATKNNSYANFNYCLPCEWVKEPEKKYRPYTLKEFVKEYPLGEEIIFKMNSNTKIIHGLFLEYTENNQEVYLGSYWYGFEELVNNYELYTSKGWRPFGIKE